MSLSPINKKLQLPCGVTLNNRLVKAAMTERISNRNLGPTKGHEKLYDQWADSGAGLLITGNVIIDRVHLESAGNVCFHNDNMLAMAQKWTSAGKKKGNHIWMQISHAGRQTNRFNAKRPLSASEVKLNKIGMFGKPKAMTESDIQQVIEGFKNTAQIAQKVGFTGVQIHSAHGYLLSQFLSPTTNLRTDKWGGNLENRSRLLKKIVQGVRATVGPNFPISVKLNSSDFQKGGFTEEESLEVVKMLDAEGVDLLEVSGGTYERLAFFELNEDRAKKSTQKREAYFIDFAKKVRAISKMPLMITGGFRSFDFCNEVLESGELDLIGMARPFITNINEIAAFLRGEVKELENLVIRTGIKMIDDGAEGGFYAINLIRLSKGKPLKLKLNPLWCTNFLMMHEFKKAMRIKL